MLNLDARTGATRRFAATAFALALAAASCVSHANRADLDLAFGVDGVVRLSVAGGGFNDVIVQPDGRIVAVGMSGADWLIARFNADGSLDTGFGSGGVRTVTPPPSPAGSVPQLAMAATLDASSRLMVAGGSYVLRLNSDGSVDSSYGSAGFYTPPLTPAQLALNLSDIIATSDGGFALSCGVNGFVGPFNSPPHTSVLKLTAAGVADNGFGSNGFATLIGDMTRIYNQTHAVAEWNGNFYVAGRSGGQSSDYRAEIVRFTQAGAVDTSFSGDGILVPFGYIGLGTVRNVATELAIQSSGLIVAGAGHLDPSQIATFARRITAAGAVDPGFDTTLAEQVDVSVPTGLLVDADDRVVLATTTPAGPIVAGRLPDGSTDTAFGTSGRRAVPFDGQPATAMALQSDGKYLLAGGLGSNVAYLARLAGTAVIPPEVATTPGAGTTLAATGGQPGSTQALGAIQFSNRGGDALIVSGCSATAGFSVTAGFPLTITQATPQNVAVSCQMPAAPLSTLNGTLTCTTNDADEPQVSFGLQCVSGAAGAPTSIPTLSTPMQLLLAGLLALLAWAGLRRTRPARG